MGLKGKNVVVTGASKGLGLGIVKRLSAEGAGIIAHYNSGDITAAQEIAKAANVEFQSFQADLSNEEECFELARKAIACGDIYGLVNNAGVCIFEDFFDIGMKNFDFTFAVNIKSAFILTQQIAKHMAEKGVKGRIVNFSSIAAESGSATQVHYSAAKGAVISFTKSAAVALGQYGITVNAILPGPIPTKHNSMFLADDEVKRGMFARMPIQSYGDPSNIADAVAYLLGDGASWTTGAMLCVDGGFLSV